MNPLEDITVVDFSQFLSGPSASLRLADLGARVIKIERPGSGDICRELYVSNTVLDGESTVFHAINRNKESLAADLKNPDDAAMVRALIETADVVMHKFRPGVMETPRLRLRQRPRAEPAGCLRRDQRLRQRRDRGATNRARTCWPSRWPD